MNCQEKETATPPMGDFSPKKEAKASLRVLDYDAFCSFDG